MKNNDKNIFTDSSCANRKEIKSCVRCKKSKNNCNRNRVVKKSSLDDKLKDKKQVLEGL